MTWNYYYIISKWDKSEKEYGSNQKKQKMSIKKTKCTRIRLSIHHTGFGPIAFLKFINVVNTLISSGNWKISFSERLALVIETDSSDHLSITYLRRMTLKKRNLDAFSPIEMFLLIHAHYSSLNAHVTTSVQIFCFDFNFTSRVRFLCLSSWAIFVFLFRNFAEKRINPSYICHFQWAPLIHKSTFTQHSPMIDSPKTVRCSLREGIVSNVEVDMCVWQPSSIYGVRLLWALLERASLVIRASPETTENNEL